MKLFTIEILGSGDAVKLTGISGISSNRIVKAIKNDRDGSIVGAYATGIRIATASAETGQTL